MTGHNGKMARDTVLYMLAKSIEGIAGIATISLITRIFREQQNDIYVLVNITSTTLAMLVISWLAQSSSRYLNDYELNNGHKPFYSTVFYAWLRVNAVVILAASLARNLFVGVETSIYILAVMFFATYNTSQLLITLLSVKRKAVTNLIISACSSVGKLVLIYLFSLVIGPRLEIIFLSYVLCDLVVIAVGFTSLGAYRHIKRSGVSKELLSSFVHYGTPLVGNLITTTVLNNSDKFIMKYYLEEGEVGIYGPNYSVVSAAFTMLMAALMRGSYPTILKTYAKGDKELTEELVSAATRNYLLLAVPAAVGFGAIAKPLAEFVFDSPGYISGYTVMVWVAFGMLFLGLAEYSNKPWELSAKTTYIFRYSLIGGIINIALNIIFMPRIGYMTAAYSTFIGFFTYFCLSKINSRKLMKWRIKPKTYVSIIISALIMGVCIHFMVISLGSSKLMLFVYVAAGVLIYGVLLALLGEITKEIRIIAQFIKSRRRK